MTHYIEIFSALILFVLLLVSLRLTRPKAKKPVWVWEYKLSESFNKLGAAAQMATYDMLIFGNKLFWPEGEPDWNWPV
jgi:hypothetical protein